MFYTKKQKDLKQMWQIIILVVDACGLLYFPSLCLEYFIILNVKFMDGRNVQMHINTLSGKKQNSMRSPVSVK